MCKLQIKPKLNYKKANNSAANGSECYAIEIRVFTFVCIFLAKEEELREDEQITYTHAQVNGMLVPHLIYMKRNKHKSSARSARSVVACILDANECRNE